MKRTKNIRKHVDIFITILILLIADNPIVMGNKFVLVGVFIFLSLVFMHRKKSIDSQIYWVIIAALMIMVFQGFRWDFSAFTFVTYTLFTIMIPYLTIKIVGIKYLRITAKVVYYISIISLVLFLGQVFIPGFTAILFGIESLFTPFSSLPERPSILIYSIATNTLQDGDLAGFLRNPGMFHEPGAFAVFIVLAIVNNIMIDDRPFSRKNIILLIALVSTFSTAGILSIFLVYGFYFFRIKKKNIKVLIVSAIIFVPLSIYVIQLPFMTNKIEFQFSNQTSSALTTSTSGRILGARKALVVLERYPFTGRGMIQASRETDDTSDEKAGYGFMLFFSQVGIVLSIIFIVFFIKGMQRIAFYFSNKKVFWLLLGGSLLINLFSQKFIGDAFFIMFFFIGLLKEFSITSLMKFNYGKKHTPYYKGVTPFIKPY